MADQTISVTTALLTGGTAAGTSGTAITVPSGDSLLIYGPSGGELDFNTMHIRLTASDSTVVGKIVASDEFTDADLGDESFSVATAKTAVIGGAGFEASRFKQTATSGTAYCEIVCSGAATFYSEVVQNPYPKTGA